MYEKTNGDYTYVGISLNWSDVMSENTYLKTFIVSPELYNWILKFFLRLIHSNFEPF